MHVGLQLSPGLQSLMSTGSLFQLSEMQAQFDVERNRSAEFLKENDKLSRLLCTVESSVADLQPLLTYHQVLVEDTMKDNSI